MEFLENLDPLLRIFWFIAIPVSIIFLIQAIITFLGVDSTDGLQADFDSNLSDGDDPFQLFSLRNLINFLLGFSWTGISFFTLITSTFWLIVLSFVVGCLFLFLFFMVMKQIQKLAENNSFNFANTLNKTAEVYLTIPANKKGKGKIMISVNGAFHELDAMSEKDKIQSGSLVKIVKIENNNLLFVEPI